MKRTLVVDDDDFGGVLVLDEEASLLQGLLDAALPEWNVPPRAMATQDEVREEIKKVQEAAVPVLIKKEKVEGARMLPRTSASEELGGG